MNENVNLDFWYDHTIEDVTKVSVSFNGSTGLYTGWMYRGEQIIGDFSAADSIELEKTFPHLNFKWD